MSALKIHCAPGFFFHSAIYNRKCAYLSFSNSTPMQLTIAQWSLFRLWQLEKMKIFRRFIHTIAQFKNVQSIIPAIDTKVFHRAPILV
jgi:hypothetical protein